MAEKRYVNLGCGQRYRAGWLNFDLNPSSPEVTRCDLSRGIPLADASCDLVYLSHVLEHLKQGEARAFLLDCFRVLKPGGVIRVAVPDLEQICRLYLESLELSGGDQALNAENRRWLLLELYDQCVREVSGGLMKEFLARPELPNESFVASRIGEEYHDLKRALQPAAPGPAVFRLPSPRALCFRALDLLKAGLLRLVLGEKGVEALKIGRFRQSGEVHQFMYDRLSLAEELIRAGFQETVVQSASTSYIERWPELGLDALPDGIPVKPDSLYMEGRRPHGG